VNITIENHGSVVLFRPDSTQTRDALIACVSVESWQWFGNALAVDARMAADLAAHLRNEGFGISG
jgi:hypothetical protein